MAQYSFALTHACAALTYPLLLLHRVTAKLGCKLADPPAMMPIAELNGSKVGRGPLKTLDGLTPTVPPPPELGLMGPTSTMHCVSLRQGAFFENEGGALGHEVLEAPEPF